MALVAVRKAMDYLFSQHDLSFLDDVIPEKDKKKKEDEKKKKKKKGSLDSDNEDVRPFLPLLTYFDALRRWLACSSFAHLDWVLDHPCFLSHHQLGTEAIGCFWSQ